MNSVKNKIENKASYGPHGLNGGRAEHWDFSSCKSSHFRSCEQQVGEKQRVLLLLSDFEKLNI